MLVAGYVKDVKAKSSHDHRSNTGVMNSRVLLATKGKSVTKGPLFEDSTLRKRFRWDQVSKAVPPFPNLVPPVGQPCFMGNRYLPGLGAHMVEAMVDMARGGEGLWPSEG